MAWAILYRYIFHEVRNLAILLLFCISGHTRMKNLCSIYSNIVICSTACEVKQKRTTQNILYMMHGTCVGEYYRLVT